MNINELSANLFQTSEDIWCVDQEDNETISFPNTGYNECFDVEDKSFWFAHRNRCLKSLFDAFPPQTKEIVDIGGGNGFNSIYLQNLGYDVVLLEPGSSGVKNAKTRGVKKIICSTIERGDFISNSFPNVLLLDVVEHIEDDVSFLSLIKEKIKDGGNVYITVPAHNFLFSHEDTFAGHFRRYKTSEIKNKLKSVGFNVLYCSYFFCFLPIPIFLFRTLPYKLGFKKVHSSKKNNDHLQDKKTANRFVSFFLKSEMKKIQKKKEMKFGGSIICVAKKVEKQ